MATPKPRVKLPKTAAKNEIVTIKSLISHDMESGQRKDSSGKIIPARSSTSSHASSTASPFSAATSSRRFRLIRIWSLPQGSGSGTFKFSWVDDDGSVYTDEQQIKVQ